MRGVEENYKGMHMNMDQLFRRNPAVWRVVLSLVVMLWLFPATLRASSPNVVLIYIDDLGYGDLGSYGCRDIPTPNLDKLAKEGVRCAASYITNPPCCPSRCSMLMGQYGQKFGKYGMSRGLSIPEDRPTLARFLQGEGYVTGHIGKWDIGSRNQGPLQTGFMKAARTPPKKQYTKKELLGLSSSLRRKLEEKNGQSKYHCIDKDGNTVWLTDHDGNSIVDFVQRHKDERFFLYWSPEAVHSFNTEVPERLISRTKAKGSRRYLAGAIASVDEQVGKLLRVLESNGLRKNTLIIFSSDNGANGGEGGSSAPYSGGKGKGTQKEGWVRVPTIFSMPGSLPQGRVHKGLIANFDFYATIAALVGKEAPPHCDGVNLLPFLNGQNAGNAHDYLFWLNNEPGDAVRRHLIAVRWKDWRLYRKYNKDPWQLFDLANDPLEESDVSGEHPEVVAQLSGKHAAWVKTLAPLREVSKEKGSGQRVATGHGWETAAKESDASGE